MIEAQGLTKRFGKLLAVNDLTFTVRPGLVTGFVGPNGAGKSTTMRLMLGLDRPSDGSVLVCGERYVDLARPFGVVGAVLDAGAFHPGRSARSHLGWMARSNGVARRRVEEVLEIVGLGSVASRRAGTFSLGMRQRLGIAGALLGDPAVLMFDEPINGLDPEGILWVRELLRGLAREGRTVLVSSHLMSEMAVTADHLLVIGKGRLIADVGVEEFLRRTTGATTRVRAPEARSLRAAIERAGGVVSDNPDGSFAVHGLDATAVGSLAYETNTLLHELAPVRVSLEEAYLKLTEDSVEFAATASSTAAPSGR